MRQRQRKDIGAVRRSWPGKMRPMYLRMRPWVRITGTVIRRVLDRFLGQLLLMVMDIPGRSGLALASSLHPSLLPAHVFDLLDLLKTLGCLTTSTYVTHDPPGSLFDQPAEIILKDDAGPEVEQDRIYYDPAVDCVSKLAAYIGTKKYADNWLSDMSDK